MTEKPWAESGSNQCGDGKADPEAVQSDEGLLRASCSEPTGSAIVACEMIEDEVRLALDLLPPQARPPVIWVESGLHDRPERLHSVLKDIIARLDEGAEKREPVVVPAVRPGRGPADARRQEVEVKPVHRVFLGFGFCGNALVGLGARNLTLIVPRADDCITLLLNHGCKREEVPRNPRHYYLTRGWFSHESSLMEAFEEWVQRYGAERAARLQKVMFAGYESVSLIDTGAYSVEECFERSLSVAQTLGLKHGVVRGSVQLLAKLFQGEADGEVVVIPPGEAVCIEHLFAVQGAGSRSAACAE